jgi:aspartyl protease family protein
MPEPLPRADDLPSRIGRAMLFGAWVAGLALLVMLFQGVMEERENPNRDLETLVDASGRAQVVLERNRAGHYVAPGRINGEPVLFLVDTGATDVALPIELARRIGLQLGAPGIGRTANGDVRTWSALLDTVELGGLTAHRVRASVLPNMPGDQVLLGMSFIKRFELIQRGTTLTVRIPG